MSEQACCRRPDLIVSQIEVIRFLVPGDPGLVFLTSSSIGGLEGGVLRRLDVGLALYTVVPDMLRILWIGMARDPSTSANEA
jgi:hypothetical protein